MFRQSAGKPDLPITSGVSPQMPGTLQGGGRGSGDAGSRGRAAGAGGRCRRRLGRHRCRLAPRRRLLRRDRAGQGRRGQRHHARAGRGHARRAAPRAARSARRHSGDLPPILRGARAPRHAGARAGPGLGLHRRSVGLRRHQLPRRRRCARGDRPAQRRQSAQGARKGHGRKDRPGPAENRRGQAAASSGARKACASATGCWRSGTRSGWAAR